MAHRTLEAGKFADHLADKICFAKTRRAQGSRLVPAKFGSDRCCEFFNTTSFVIKAAEILLESHLPQILDPIFERSVAIFLPKKSGIRKPGSKDPLVARAHAGNPAAFNIAHCNKFRQELAALIHHVKKFLMVAHGRYQHLRRNLEKGGVKISDQGSWPLHQSRHCV